jgi:hypothetical protein
LERDPVELVEQRAVKTLDDFCANPAALRAHTIVRPNVFICSHSSRPLTA